MLYTTEASLPAKYRMLLHILRGLSVPHTPAFTEAASVTLRSLDPSNAHDQWEIDRATAWCESKEHCAGEYRRRIRASAHEVTFEFERVQDATLFRLLF